MEHGASSIEHRAYGYKIWIHRIKYRPWCSQFYRRNHKNFVRLPNHRQPNGFDKFVSFIFWNESNQSNDYYSIFLKRAKCCLDSHQPYEQFGYGRVLIISIYAPSVQNSIQFSLGLWVTRIQRFTIISSAPSNYCHLNFWYFEMLFGRNTYANTYPIHNPHLYDRCFDMWLLIEYWNLSSYQIVYYEHFVTSHSFDCIEWVWFPGVFISQPFRLSTTVDSNLNFKQIGKMKNKSLLRLEKNQHTNE